MRLWRAANGDLLTDKQVIRYVATFESLSEAAGRGDVRLVSGDADEDVSRSSAPMSSGSPPQRRRPRLADLLS